jgi:hypothetical protein
MDRWRGVAADGSMRRRIRHGPEWVDDSDLAVVEALLRAGWTLPGSARHPSTDVEAAPE